MSGSRIPSLGPRGEGWLALQILLMVAIPLAAWREARVDVDQAPIVDLYRAVGTVALLGGLGLIAWSRALLRRSSALSAFPLPRESGAMVASGPYRLIRHPIYGGLLLSAAAVALIRASAIVAVLALALAVVLDLKRRREEVWLTGRYVGYAAYRARTKALVPFVY